jgi:hypothetical protein
MFVQMKDSEFSNSEHRIQELKAAHQQELADIDRRWHHCLDQQLAEAEARYKDELTELSREWRWERKVQFYLVCALQLLQLHFVLTTVRHKTVHSCTYKEHGAFSESSVIC